jgi:hypothetical protein
MICGYKSKPGTIYTKYFAYVLNTVLCNSLGTFDNVQKRKRTDHYTY